MQLRRIIQPTSLAPIGLATKYTWRRRQMARSFGLTRGMESFKLGALTTLLEFGFLDMDCSDGKKILSDRQAYAAMFSFLENYYRSTNADEIGSLLGSMSIVSDGLPLDRALWDDWKSAVEKSINDEVDVGLQLTGSPPSTDVR